MIPVILEGADRYCWTIPGPGEHIAVLATDPPRLAELGNLGAKEAELAEVTAVRALGGIWVKSNEGPDILLERTGCHAWVRLEEPPVFPFALGFCGQQTFSLGGWLTAWTAP